MLIGLISDTHDHVPHIHKAVAVFKDKKVEMVIHAGDYCSPFTILPFEGLPLKGVFGNNDGDKYLLMQKFREIDAELLGEFFEWQTGDCKLAVYHGTYQAITKALIRCGKYDVVISGHTHETRYEKTGSTLAVNPGTAHGFDKEATVALLDTDALEVGFIEIG